jgi:hypothetical protein
VRQHRARHLSQTRIKASVIGWINHVRYGDTWAAPWPFCIRSCCNMAESK